MNDVISKLMVIIMWISFTGATFTDFIAVLADIIAVIIDSYAAFVCISILIYSL